MEWPGGKPFAFTVFDDADQDRMSNTQPVYDFLAALGFRTTKSVWTLDGLRPGANSGLSTADPAYLAWILSLRNSGFEIGFHGARYHSSPREDTRLALDRFREQFGADPRTFANHFQNEESIHWGSGRLVGLTRAVHRAATFRHPVRPSGHVEGSPFFWGDLCHERIAYVRNFVFREIDTLRCCPFMPYRDPALPWVRAWFASSEGGDLRSFVQTVSERAQDRLEERGGACIMYAHFAKGFYDGSRLDPRFVALMERLAAKGGWFVPVGDLLDHLAARQGGIREITPSQRRALQWRWLLPKLVSGSS